MIAKGRKINLDLGVPGVTAEENEDFIWLKYRDQVSTFSAVGATIEKLRETARYMVRVAAIAVGTKSYSVTVAATYRIDLQAESEEEAKQKATDLWASWPTPGAIDVNLDFCGIIKSYKEEIKIMATWSDIQVMIRNLEETIRNLEPHYYPTRREAIAAILDIQKIDKYLEALKGRSEGETE